MIKAIVVGLIIGALVVGGIGINKVAQQQRAIEGLYTDVSNINVDIGNLTAFDEALMTRMGFVK